MLYNTMPSNKAQERTVDAKIKKLIDRMTKQDQFINSKVSQIRTTTESIQTMMSKQSVRFEKIKEAQSKKRKIWKQILQLTGKDEDSESEEDESPKKKAKRASEKEPIKKARTENFQIASDDEEYHSDDNKEEESIGEIEEDDDH